VSVRAVLAGGFAVLVVALAVTLLQSAPRSAGSNLVPEQEEVAKLRAPARHCQDGEILPADTGALRFLIGTYGEPAPPIGVRVTRPNGTLLTSGRLPGGGPEGHVDIPMREVDSMQGNLRVCLSIGGGDRVVLYGAAGRVRFEWMRPDSESWLGLFPTIAHRFSLGRWNPLGTLLLPVLALLLVATWVAAALLVLRTPARPWGFVAVAVVNAVVWSFVTPPFQLPDETSHVAYVQHFSQHAEPPNEPGGPVFSSQEAALLESLRFGSTVGRSETGTISSEAEDDVVDATEKRELPTGNDGGIQSNSNQPPLFFALETIAYAVTPSDDLLDRLVSMRLLAALMAGATTLFVFLFLRELFAAPWTWTVGALAVAFQPLFGFISSGVTPDALLFTASAALFFALARAFRQGLTVRRGLGIGAALAIGVLAKLNFIALLPGALLGVGLLLLRGRERRPALSGVGVAAAGLGAAAVAYIGLNRLVWDRSAWGGGLEAAATNATGGPAGAPGIGLAEQLSYTWQLYLPRLPFMNDQFAYFPPYTSWFKGTVGIFGWLDTSFAAWAYNLALGIAIPLALLALLGLWQRRAVLVERWPEPLTWITIAAGLLGSIGFLGIRYRADSGFAFEQARYLLPLLALYASAVALAALAVGRRWGRQLGAALVVLALAQGVFAQLLVIGRFYA
jgi:4-amino-4-deoxy-L-arabinose transferase-like glycosyltransferase